MCIDNIWNVCATKKVQQKSLLFPDLFTHTRSRAYTFLKAKQRLEAHPPPEPERMVTHTHDQHPALDHIPDLSETSFTTVDSHIDLEHVPMHVLGVDTIHKGALIGSGGMSAVYNGKYGTIPDAAEYE